MPMPDDPTPGGLGREPNDFETMNPLLAARFGEVASYLAESLPRRAAAIGAQRIHIARELKRVPPPRPGRVARLRYRR